VVRRTFKGFAALGLIGALSATSGSAQEAAPAPAPAPAAKPAEAAAGVEEIIVTSRLREESIQEVPIAVSHFGESMLKELGTDNLQDLDGLAPNLYISRSVAGPGAGVIYIRGLGYGDIEKTVTPNVGVVIDDVFVPSSTGQLIDTFDIESIEVNRGPQAILWGRNTSGGTIVVHRGQPKLGEYDARVYTSYGNYIGGKGEGGAFKVQSMVNIPLTDETLALRAGYTYKSDQGVAKNLLTGESRGAVDYQAITAKLLFQPTDELSVGLNWDWIRDRSDIPPVDARWDGVQPWTNRSDRNPKELAPYDVSLLSAQINYDLPFNAKLTSVSAFWNSTDLVYQDFDGGRSDPLNSSNNDPQSVFARLHTRRDQDYDVFSQEIRLVGNLLDESLTYIAGFYYAHDKHDMEQRTEQQLQIDFFPTLTGPPFNVPPAVVAAVPCAGFFGPAFPFDGPVLPNTKLCDAPTNFGLQRTSLRNTSWALFGSVEYELPWIEGLRINGGVRYIKEQKDFTTAFNAIANNTLVGSTIGAVRVPKLKDSGSWDDVVGEAGVSYQVTEDILGYYRFAQGFRSGGFSIRASQPVPTCTAANTPTFPVCAPGTDPRAWTPFFEPETTTSHEAGIKSAWFDGRLTANVAAFYTEVKGAQGSVVISGITGAGTDTVVLNGGFTKIYGTEFQAALEVIEGLNVDFTLGWQKAGDNGSTQSTHNLGQGSGDTVCNATAWYDDDNDPLTPLVRPPREVQSEATCPVSTFENQALARVPELSWSIAGTYRLAVGPGEVVLSSRVRHQDFSWILPPTTNTAGATTNIPVGQSAYSLVDASVSYEFELDEHKIHAGIVGHNLTNKAYREGELNLGTGGFRNWGMPRYVGGELSFEL
jgi:iron complex outermembrane receptor protein